MTEPMATMIQAVNKEAAIKLLKSKQKGIKVVDVREIMSGVFTIYHTYNLVNGKKPRFDQF